MATLAEEEVSENIIENLKNKTAFCFSDIIGIVQNNLDQDKDKKEAYKDPANWPMELELEVPIFREGRFDHWWYGELNYTIDNLNKMIQNFNSKVVPYDISFDMEHLYRFGALAWVPYEEGSLFVKKVPVKTVGGEKDKNVLYSKCVLNRAGVQKILGKEVKYFSSEIDPDFSTNEIVQVNIGNGTLADTVLSFGETLVGGGFTNRPFIPGMSAAFSNRNFSNEALKNGLKFNDGKAITLLVEDDVVIDQSNQYSLGKILIYSDSSKSKQVTKPQTVQVLENLTNNTFNNTDQKEPEGVSMKLQELLAKLTGKNDNEKFSILNDAVGQIEESEKFMFNTIFDAVKQNIEKDKLVNKFSHEKELLEQEKIRLSEEKTNLEYNLRISQEKSWSDRVDSEAIKLSQSNHHTSVINEFKRLFSKMPEDVRNMKFSVDTEEFNPMTLVLSIINKIPQDARLTTEFNLTNNGDKKAVTPIDPNDGAKDGLKFNNTSDNNNNAPVDKKFAHVPQADLEKVKKYNARYPSMPIPQGDLIKAIDENGFINLSSK